MLNMEYVMPLPVILVNCNRPVLPARWRRDRHQFRLFAVYCFFYHCLKISITDAKVRSQPPLVSVAAFESAAAGKAGSGWETAGRRTRFRLAAAPGPVHRSDATRRLASARHIR